MRECFGYHRSMKEGPDISQIGALIGTIMVANVFIIIIPYQKKTVAALIAGREPDPEWGEIVVAYVVGEAARDELDRLCLSRIARFKRPTAYMFVEGLPKNNYGKVLKTELRTIDRDATRDERQPPG